MSTKRFNVGQVKQPDKLEQKFSFTGKIRGADVLRRLVEVCGYEVIHEALEKLNPEPVLPTPKRSKAKRMKAPSGVVGFNPDTGDSASRK